MFLSCSYNRPGRTYSPLPLPWCSVSVPAKASDETTPTNWVPKERQDFLDRKVQKEENCTNWKTGGWITKAIATQRKARQGDSKGERETESGKITTPTRKSVSLHPILHTDGCCKETQAVHLMQAHTLRPHRCSCASETRKSGSPPFHWAGESGRKNLSMNQQPAHLWP